MRIYRNAMMEDGTLDAVDISEDEFAQYYSQIMPFKR